MQPLVARREMHDLLFLQKGLLGMLNGIDFDHFIQFNHDDRTRSSSLNLKTNYCKTTTFSGSYSPLELKRI